LAELHYGEAAMPKNQNAPPSSSAESDLHRRVLLREAKIAIQASPMTVQWLLTLSDEEIGGLYRNSFNAAVALAGLRARARMPGVALTNARLLDAGQILLEFGVSSRVIARDAAASRAFAVEINGVDHYPSFLFDGTIDRKTLTKVIRQLGPLEGWSKWHFFVSRRRSLNSMTPLAALEQGEVDAVLKAATAFAEC
jgi:hypothetical protein